MTLFATDEVMNDLLENPTKYGFENSSDACLDLKGDSPTGYLFNHKLTKDCMEKGSDKYVLISQFDIFYTIDTRALINLDSNIDRCFTSLKA